VDTLFIGGGTPTHLSAEWLSRLLELVRYWFPLSHSSEFSVEANPSDISDERLDVLHSAGVNRLSLGVQSFQSKKLAILERDHNAEIATRAITLGADAIKNVSIDLIFASPHETVDDWKRDLQTALSLPISHISTYCLTFEKGSRFWGRLLRDPTLHADEETELSMYQEAILACKSHGLEHYEISNFALPNKRCVHNQAYWEGRGWFAAGPSAARFVNGRREVNHRSPTTYIQRLLRNESATIESDSLSRETWARERLAFGLRMLEGISLAAISDETGCALEQLFARQIHQFCADGLIERHAGRLRLTEKGLFVSDSIVTAFL
jgi:oxygen-independent coproporphyrinogen-3 oxidase